MNENNTFANFDQFLDTLDPAIVEDVREIETTTRIARRLQLIRMKKGLSQKVVADRIGCTQGNISKIENKFDDDLTLGDLRLYLQAVQSGMGFSIGPNLTLAESINKNITELDQDLQKLKVMKREEDQELSQAIDEYLATSHSKLLSIVLKGLGGMLNGFEIQETQIHFDVAITKEYQDQVLGGNTLVQS